MPITQDAFGNFYAGGYLQGDQWEPNDLLTLMRTALLSNDRANINRLSSSFWKIEWRPNETTTDETKTGVIATPTDAQMSAVNNDHFTLGANSRLAFGMYSISSASRGVYLLDSAANAVRLGIDNGGLINPAFSNAGSYWGVATEDSISYFVNQGSDYWFFSQGFLQDAQLAFPNNRYAFLVRTTSNPRAVSDSYSGSLVPFSVSGATANFAHIKESDAQATTSEVELCLRRQSDSAYLGFVPNVWKRKVDGGETVDPIGSIVRMNLDSAAISGNFYSDAGDPPASQGNAFGIVVGRLGTDETTLDQDYLVMRVRGV